MALDDVVKAVLVEDEGIANVVKTLKTLQTNPKELLGEAVTPDRVSAAVENSISKIKDYVETYIQGETAQQQSICTLLGRDENLANITLQLLATEEKARIKRAIENKKLGNYVSDAFDKATGHYKEALEQIDDESKTRLKEEFNYSELSPEIQDLVKTGVFMPVPIIMSVVTQYVGLTKEPKKLLGPAATKEEIDQAKSKAEETIDKIVNAYFGYLQPETKTFISENLKKGNTAMLQIFASYERSILLGAYQTLPEGVKSDIGYEVLRARALNREIVTPNELPESLAEYQHADFGEREEREIEVAVEEE